MRFRQSPTGLILSSENQAAIDIMRASDSYEEIPDETPLVTEIPDEMPPVEGPVENVGEARIFTEADLNAMTVPGIKSIAAERGYTLTKTLKTDLIAEFLTMQNAPEEEGG